MDYPKLKPVGNTDALRSRVERFFREISKSNVTKSNISKGGQLSLESISELSNKTKMDLPRYDVNTFLELVKSSIVDGDTYIFGGIIRDLAIFGKEGFHSDIDIVVDGDWSDLVPILKSYGALENKFGGLRLVVDNWPIDIWEAKNTWAIKQGHIKYQGIASLTDTTVLNWDGILMNLRTKNFVYRKDYFEELSERILDIVLVENPNPIGMLIRVLRHFKQKDATKISYTAVKYLVHALNLTDYQTIRDTELSSYGTNLIDKMSYDYFRTIDFDSDGNIFSTYKHHSEKGHLDTKKALDIQSVLF